MHITQKELENKFKVLKKVHMIGITSPFSSFCATHLMNNGIKVTASELRQDTPSAQEWVNKGVLFPGPHNAKFITEDIDLVVVPNGAIPGNPEIEKMNKLDKPYVLIQELLGVISKQYKTIAIAGTHGKTTTTSLIVWLIHKTIGTPNFIVGDAKDKIGGDLQSNLNISDASEYLVIESCEYKKQFLSRVPTPNITVITHIDLDHTDFYTSQEMYNDAFAEFIGNTQDSLIIDATKTNEIDSLSKSEYTGEILSTDTLKNEIGRIETILPGAHNQENLVRAFAVGRILGIKDQEILSALETYPGITARFEHIGETRKDSPVYWDYAHNPEKITGALAGARELFPEKKIIAIYQPHNHERTHSSKNGLLEALKEADAIIVPNIYSSRETEETKALISAEDFVSEMREKYPQKEVIFTNDIAPFSKTANLASKYENSNSVVIIITAGDLIKIRSEILKSEN